MYFRDGLSRRNSSMHGGTETSAISGFHQTLIENTKETSFFEKLPYQKQSCKFA